MDISNNINSAIVSGTLGIQRASKEITQNTSNLASLSAFSVPSSDPQEFLANATIKQLSSIKQLLPEASDGSPIPLDLIARWTQESGSKKNGLCVPPCATWPDLR